MRPEEIIQEIETKFCTPREKFLGKRRTEKLAWLRHLTCFLLYHHTDLTLTEVGDLVGGRHHSTIISSIKKIAALSDTNLAYQTSEEIIELFQLNCPESVFMLPNGKVNLLSAPLPRKESLQTIALLKHF